MVGDHSFATCHPSTRSIGSGNNYSHAQPPTAPPQLLLNVVRCYALAALRGISLRHYAKCAFNRFALRHLSPRQLQYVVPPTQALYKSWVARRRKRAAIASSTAASNGGGDRAAAAFLASRLARDIEPLPDGASALLWLGDRRRATRFVLFFHGGGYVVPALAGHLEWCARAYLLASPAAGREQDDGGEEVAVAVLQYTLSPDGRYPTPLRQAAGALAHLFASGAVRPGNLVVGGDSAGGNLTAQVLSHLLRPHPAVAQVPLAEPLAGAFLVSPWLSGRTDWPSFARNGGIDMLSAETLRSGPENVGSYEAELRDGKGWAMPMDLDDPAAWFAGLDKVVREVYVTAGEQEVFLDQAVGFAEAVRRGNPGMSLKLDVMRDAAHDWILLEGDAGEDGESMRKMRDWAKSVFWP